MRFVKREGDAVFCYADAATFREGERLVELIEACYFDFSNRLLDMTRATTCRCAACGTIDSLGLKFVAHYGSFVVEHDDGRDDLAGPDVILAHRSAEEHDQRWRRPAGIRFLHGGVPAALAVVVRAACRTARRTNRSARREAASMTSLRC